MSKRKETINVPDKLVEGWDSAQKAIDENATMLSERSYSLATGGLAISFSIMSFIIEDYHLDFGWQAPLIWAGFILCIIADTWSVFDAKRQAEKLELLFRDKIHKGETMTEVEVNNLIARTNKRIRRINIIVFGAILLLICASLLYCSILLYK